MKFKVFSNRWNHENIYGVKITNNGWYVRYAGKGGDCDKKGEPFFYELFDDDYIDYPPHFGDYLEFLWYESYDKTKLWIQKRLDELSEWLRYKDYKLNDEFWSKMSYKYDDEDLL
jgi:hypothetical protein